jgi:hypothetical protein
MKTYTLSFSRSITHRPDNPERTAKRNSPGLSFDVTYQVWSSRAGMLKTIEMQGKRGARITDWKACSRADASTLPKH